MTKAEFNTLLAKYNLTVNAFLDICDEWNRLTHKCKYELLIEDSNVLEVSDGRIEDIFDTKS